LPKWGSSHGTGTANRQARWCWRQFDPSWRAWEWRPQSPLPAAGAVSHFERAKARQREGAEGEAAMKKP
jgi:hypothetical protein